MRLLSRNSLLAGLGVLLLAGSASALTTVYNVTDMNAIMTTVNQVCAVGVCQAPLSGTITIDDDLAGNVAITAMSLSHPLYEVATGSPTLISVKLERTNITLGAGPILGTGSTTSVVDFGGTTLTQTGTTTCASIIGLCEVYVGAPPGTYPLPSSVVILDMGTWIFDSARNIIDGVTPYQIVTGSSEFMIIPEPGTILLLAMGMAGMAIRRRAGF
jgi:PEP-CTERM motif-containing protein